MTATTLTLADFLLQRLAEDEAAARAATPGPWFADAVYSTVTAAPFTSARAAYDADHWDGVDRFVVPESMDSAVSDVNLAHIARHDPARVLAECEAKRAIVEQFRPGRIVLHDSTGVHAQTGEMDDPRGVDILRALASVYADHPDFDPAWSMAAEFVVSPGRLHDLADVAAEFGVDLDAE